MKRRTGDMPLYDLYCKCGYTSERLLKLNSKLPECPVCKEELKRAMCASSFILKGNCWSKDNYSRRSKEV